LTTLAGNPTIVPSRRGRQQNQHQQALRHEKGSDMSKRISRIAPWQAGKLFALIYFGVSLFFVILIVVFSGLLPAGTRPNLGTGALLLLPLLYALAGLIFVPLTCWVYNLAASVVGGLEISLTDDGGA
jgi:hypothetical protein